jgi:hypothetical protein
LGVPSTSYPLVRTVTQLVRSLLADDGASGWGFPFGSNGPLITIVVVSGVCTATFPIAPGFITDDIIQLAGWPPPLNGQFTVSLASGPQIIWQNNAVPNGNYQGGTIQGWGTGKKWTDPLLTPFVNSAYRGLQRALRGIGSTEFRQGTAFVTIPGLSFSDPSTQVFLTFEGLSITSDVNPAPVFIEPPSGVLPDDFLIHRKMWERPTASTSLQFVPVTDLTNTGGVPSRAQGGYLGVFSWEDDGFVFVGSTNNTDIKIEYDRGLPPVADGSSQLLILNSEDYHAYSVAEMVEKSRGGKNVAQFQSDADDAKEKLIAAFTRSEQFIPRRSKPFSSRRGWGRRYF